MVTEEEGRLLLAQTYIEVSPQQQAMGGQHERPAGQEDRARDYGGMMGLKGVK